MWSRLNTGNLVAPCFGGFATSKLVQLARLPIPTIQSECEIQHEILYQGRQATGDNSS